MCRACDDGHDFKHTEWDVTRDHPFGPLRVEQDALHGATQEVVVEVDTVTHLSFADCLRIMLFGKKVSQHLTVAVRRAHRTGYLMGHVQHCTVELK